MLLDGKKGLVVNVTNKNSLGWGIADLANQQGATVGIGAQNERLGEGVAKLIEGRSGFVPVTVDFAFEEQYASLRTQVEEKIGKLDFLVHSVGYAPKTALENRFLETTLEDFLVAMNASAYSFVRLCREMDDLLNDDASVITLTYLGSTRAMPNYNVMGMCKAALEASVRYLAYDLGGRGIRVNAVSPGPVNTVSGRGVKGLSGMINHVYEMAPLKRPYAQPEVAKTSLYLISELSGGVSGQILMVDSGYSIMAM